MKRVRSCPTFSADRKVAPDGISSNLTTSDSQVQMELDNTDHREGTESHGREYCHAWLKYGFCPASYLCRSIESDATKSSKSSSDSQSSGSLSKEEREERDYEDRMLYSSGSFDSNSGAGSSGSQDSDNNSREHTDSGGSDSLSRSSRDKSSKYRHQRSKRGTLNTTDTRRHDDNEKCESNPNPNPTNTSDANGRELIGESNNTNEENVTAEKENDPDIVIVMGDGNEKRVYPISSSLLQDLNNTDNSTDSSTLRAPVCGYLHSYPRHVSMPEKLLHRKKCEYMDLLFEGVPLTQFLKEQRLSMGEIHVESLIQASLSVSRHTERERLEKRIRALMKYSEAIGRPLPLAGPGSGGQSGGAPSTDDESSSSASKRRKGNNESDNAGNTADDMSSSSSSSRGTRRRSKDPTHTYARELLNSSISTSLALECDLWLDSRHSPLESASLHFNTGNGIAGNGSGGISKARRGRMRRQRGASDNDSMSLPEALRPAQVVSDISEGEQGDDEEST